MPYNHSSMIWPSTKEHYYRDRKFEPIKQDGPHCVSTVLAILTGETPEFLQGIINTQDPISWSDVLKRWNMKLAYCSTDARRLKHYIKELIKYDDLFTLSYYTNPDEILGEPDEKGWVARSHIVILHRDRIIDPAMGESFEAINSKYGDFHTKRIFRVVPAYHIRGL